MSSNMKWILALIVIMATGACSKRLDKLLPTPPFAVNNNPGSAGSIRLLDFSQLGDYDVSLDRVEQGSSFDLSINDKQLTSFVSTRGPLGGSTAWFSGGKFIFGKNFTIPDSLFDPKGDGILKLFYTYYTTSNPQDAGYTVDPRDSSVLKRTLSLHNNPNQPQDIYFYDGWLPTPIGNPGSATNSRMGILTTQRSLGPSIQPDHFKVRLINLAGKTISDPLNQLTLTYADGSAVDTKTTAVSYPQASDYVELPYGTYYFGIMDQAGNQVQEIPTAVPAGGTTGTYYPGAVITFVVFHATYTDPSSGIQTYSPYYNIVSDIAASTQPNFIRMQGIDAVPGLSNLRFAVDGQPLGDFMQFGQHTDYATFSVGPHTLQLMDGSNRVLASRDLSDTYPMNNFSIWAYMSNGQLQLQVSGNDMSKAVYPFGTQTGLTPNPPGVAQWQCRFLNLSTDVPYVSFIDSVGFEDDTNDHITLPQAWQHLGIGEVLDDRGVVSGQSGKAGANISVYNSPPDEFPGTALGPVLHYPMVANPSLYKPGKMPVAEPGVYSIALIGSAADNSLQLITIKHNK
jgi:hypothetical protein